MLRRMLVVAGGCLVLGLVAWASAGGVHANTISRLTPNPPAGFEPTAQATGLQPPAPIELADGWQYVADPHNVGLRHNWAHGGAKRIGWRPVAIPNVFNAAVSRQSYAGSDGWYRLQFTGPSEAPGRSWVVRFGAVRRRADVWLNGHYLGASTDGYAPSSFPVPELLAGRPNVLLVRVDSRRGSGSFPQDWWNWGGIVQPVWLAPVGRLALENLGVMPELGCRYTCADLLVEGTLHNLAHVPLAARLIVRLRSPHGIALTWSQRVPVVAAGASVPVAFRVRVHGRPDLWAPGHPSLYRVQIATNAQGRVEQVDSVRVGLRSVQVRGGILYLNGKRLWLHGASIHEDVPGRGAALSDGDIRTIVSELRAVGANITRAHYLLDERLLDALDAAGILVWSQPPVDHADGVLATALGRVHALDLVRATILGERSHPSVIINSVGNELSPTPDTTPGTLSYLQQAIPLTRELDPVAAVAVDTFCYPGFPAQQIYSTVDVIGISHYFGWYKGLPGHPITDFNQLAPFLMLSHSRYPQQALVVAEFGAEGAYHGAATVKGTYEFQADYLQKTFSVLDQLPFMNGAIYWTLREFAVNPGWTGGVALPPGQLPDGIHHKGLLAYDGAEKPAFPLAQQLFAATPAYAR